jgi:hypothetical protein
MREGEEKKDDVKENGGKTKDNGETEVQLKEKNLCKRGKNKTKRERENYEVNFG